MIVALEIQKQNMFFKTVVLKHFAKFTGKHLCFFLTKFAKKETLAQAFSCEFCEIFKNIFFLRTPLVAASAATQDNKLEVIIL